MKNVEKKLCLKLKPIFFSKAPMARKLHPNAIAGLSADRTDLKPLRKYPELIINRQETIFQRQDFLINHFLHQQWRFGQKLKHNQYLQTQDLFLRFAQP